MEAIALQPQTRPLRVALVDDDADIRSAIRALILHVLPTATVKEAPSAEAGLALAQAEAFDLFIADYRMPGHDGAWLVREARKLQPTARFWMLTGQPDRYLGELSGATVLSKPIDPELLSEMVRGAAASANERRSPA